MRILIVDAYEAEAPRGRDSYDRFRQYVTSSVDSLDSPEVHEFIERRLDELGDFVVDWDHDALNDTSKFYIKRFDRLDMVFIGGDMKTYPWNPIATQAVTLVRMILETCKPLCGIGFGAFITIYSMGACGNRFNVLNEPDGGVVADLPTFPHYGIGYGAYPSTWMCHETGDMYKFEAKTSEWKPICNIGIHLIPSSGAPSSNTITPKTPNYLKGSKKITSVGDRADATDKDEVVGHIQRKSLHHPFLSGIASEGINFRAKLYPDWYLNSEGALPNRAQLRVLVQSAVGPIVLGGENMLLMTSKLERGVNCDNSEIVRRIIDNYVRSTHAQMASATESVETRTTNVATARLFDYLFGSDGFSGGSYDSVRNLRPYAPPLSKKSVKTVLPNGPVKVDPPPISLFFRIPKIEQVSSLALTSQRRNSTVGRTVRMAVQNPLSARIKRMETFFNESGYKGHEGLIRSALTEASPHTNAIQDQQQMPEHTRELLSGRAMRTESIAVRGNHNKEIFVPVKYFQDRLRTSSREHEEEILEEEGYEDDADTEKAVLEEGKVKCQAQGEGEERIARELSAGCVHFEPFVRANGVFALKNGTIEEGSVEASVTGSLARGEITGVEVGDIYNGGEYQSGEEPDRQLDTWAAVPEPPLRDESDGYWREGRIGGEIVRGPKSFERTKHVESQAQQDITGDRGRGKARDAESGIPHRADHRYLAVGRRVESSEVDDAEFWDFVARESDSYRTNPTTQHTPHRAPHSNQQDENERENQDYAKDMISKAAEETVQHVEVSTSECMPASDSADGRNIPVEGGHRGVGSRPRHAFISSTLDSGPTSRISSADQQQQQRPHQSHEQPQQKTRLEAVAGESSQLPLQPAIYAATVVGIGNTQEPFSANPTAPEHPMIIPLRPAYSDCGLDPFSSSDFPNPIPNNPSWGSASSERSSQAIQQQRKFSANFDSRSPRPASGASSMRVGGIAGEKLSAAKKTVSYDEEIFPHTADAHAEAASRNGKYAQAHYRCLVGQRVAPESSSGGGIEHEHEQANQQQNQVGASTIAESGGEEGDDSSSEASDGSATLKKAESRLRPNPGDAHKDQAVRQPTTHLHIPGKQESKEDRVRRIVHTWRDTHTEADRFQFGGARSNALHYKSAPSTRGSSTLVGGETDRDSQLSPRSQGTHAQRSKQIELETFFAPVNSTDDDYAMKIDPQRVPADRLTLHVSSVDTNSLRRYILPSNLVGATSTATATTNAEKPLLRASIFDESARRSDGRVVIDLRADERAREQLREELVRTYRNRRRGSSFDIPNLSTAATTAGMLGRSTAEARAVEQAKRVQRRGSVSADIVAHKTRLLSAMGVAATTTTATATATTISVAEKEIRKRKSPADGMISPCSAKRTTYPRIVSALNPAHSTQQQGSESIAGTDPHPKSIAAQRITLLLPKHHPAPPLSHRVAKEQEQFQRKLEAERLLQQQQQQHGSLTSSLATPSVTQLSAEALFLGTGISMSNSSVMSGSGADVESKGEGGVKVGCRETSFFQTSLRQPQPPSSDYRHSRQYQMRQQVRRGSKVSQPSVTTALSSPLAGGYPLSSSTGGVHGAVSVTMDDLLHSPRSPLASHPTELHYTDTFRTVRVTNKSPVAVSRSPVRVPAAAAGHAGTSHTALLSPHARDLQNIGTQHLENSLIDDDNDMEMRHRPHDGRFSASEIRGAAKVVRVKPDNSATRPYSSFRRLSKQIEKRNSKEEREPYQGLRKDGMQYYTPSEREYKAQLGVDVDTPSARSNLTTNNNKKQYLAGDFRPSSGVASSMPLRGAGVVQPAGPFPKSPGYVLPPGAVATDFVLFGARGPLEPTAGSGAVPGKHGPDRAAGKKYVAGGNGGSIGGASTRHPTTAGVAIAGRTLEEPEAVETLEIQWNRPTERGDRQQRTRSVKEAGRNGVVGNGDVHGGKSVGASVGRDVNRKVNGCGSSRAQSAGIAKFMTRDEKAQFPVRPFR